MTDPIPANYRRVTPCLIVNGAAKALDFYAQAFGATERSRIPGPGGSIVHAETEVGDSVIMVEDANPMSGTTAPPAGGLAGTPVYQFVYVADVDAVVKRAVELGAELKRGPQDQFYGDRDAFIIDPFGHGWVVASHVEDVSPEQLAARMSAMFGQAQEDKS
jgi:PhnB protein